MLKNMRIGRKIAFGIGLMLIIILGVLLFTYNNLNTIENSSTELDAAVLPEIEETGLLELHMLETMYAMRGYGLTGQEDLLEEARMYFAEAKNHINNANALVAEHSELTDLASGMSQIQNEYNVYNLLIEDTEAVFVEIVKARSALDENAGLFVKNAEDYKENMFVKLKQQTQDNDTSERLLARIWKTEKIVEIVSLGNQTRVLNFKAQALDDYTMFTEAYTNFDQILVLTSELKAASTAQVNIDQMEGIEESVENYRSAMQVMENSLKRLSELAQARDQAGQNLAKTSADTFKIGLEHGIEKSAAMVELSKSSTRSLLLGFALALILGVLINTYIVRGITSRLGRITQAAKTLATGDINVDLDVNSTDEVGQLGQAFKTMTENIQSQAAIAEEIAGGNLDAVIEVRSEADVLNINFQLMASTLKRLTTDMEELIDSAKAGNLAVRINSSSYNGGWSHFVDQLNKFVEVVEEPVNYVSSYIEDMAAGNALQKIVTKEEKAFDYKDEMTDQTLRSYVNKFDGDFEKLINNLSNVQEALYVMLGEANALTAKAQDGDLSHRADLSQLNGSWKSIMNGFNTAIDTIVLPIEEAAEVLGRMSEGDLKARVMGDYAGDHARIKNAANTMISTLTSYIEEMDYVLSEMADGNLNVRVEQDYVGDFQQIRTSLINIVDSFNITFSEINTAADQVSDGSQEVSKSAQALSQGATEQAGSIQEITAAMTELGDKTKDNASSASRARDLSLSAKTDAETGNSHMKQMIDAMGSINESSSNISKIISVIDEIAFQTNILALNAAVEAARAGEHGKGFAVVAEEVRNLAARSANAAKETTSLIESSIEQVNDGTKIANNTADALNKIVEGVSNAADLVSTIADASTEQAVSITQINQGIDEVSMVTQTNSATAQQSAAASEEMSSQALMLKDMVERFKLRNSGGSSRRSVTNESVSIKKPVEYVGNSYPKYTEEKDVETIQIDLDDREFGKY